MGEIKRERRLLENPLRVTQVGVDVAGNTDRIATVQRLCVQHDDRVVIHVDSAGLRCDRQGDLMVLSADGRPAPMSMNCRIRPQRGSAPCV